MIYHALTQQGKTYTDEIEYVVIHNEDGELAILKDHTPIILQVREGYIKLVSDKTERYIVIEQGVIEFKNNELSILSLEAQMGDTLEKARSTFDLMKKEKLNLAKKENVDFSKLERELKENITKGKAGQL
ncbi:MAG: F0F1 ATP synthase subunit epsilon [Acholeplasmataceae bacterium]|nr:F0F1 ATP synthase subunit epsilon [Acholeplasmataceae bacterium]